MVVPTETCYLWQLWLLNTPTFVGSPQPLHAISLERHSCKLDKTLRNVEVDEGRDLEEAHRVSLGVQLSFEGVDLSTEGQMKPVAN